ncbi:MAG: CRP/FNR family transcriptional regulator, anaerobic regulatory protein [Microgenomates group bacterium Gr01-1014_93]|nr:MAG: CRP/FNR family transcriptional regulator, anaerobic regulatory protein [Microgenomates group bacterium Gr01-1014_93]
MTLEDFFSKFRLLHYKKHEVIIRPGDDPPGVFFLSRGYVKVYTLSESGQELDLIIFKPGDFFPVIWAFNEVTLSQYCESMTPVEIYRTSKAEFMAFLKSNPDVLVDVTSKILIRLRGLLERMEYMVFGNAYQKVASILVICAERFGLVKNHGIIIRVPLTHKDVANLIGLTRETTSVELKRLERSGIITKKSGQFRVRKLEKLKEEALWSQYV